LFCFLLITVPKLACLIPITSQAYWKMVFEEMGVEFSVKLSCILRESDAYPGGEWLPGAELNAAENCLTAKPGRNSDDVGIVWRDEGRILIL
jgi:hypothetical protein